MPPSIPLRSGPSDPVAQKRLLEQLAARTEDDLHGLTAEGQAEEADRQAALWQDPSYTGFVPGMQEFGEVADPYPGTVYELPEGAGYKYMPDYGPNRGRAFDMGASPEFDPESMGDFLEARHEEGPRELTVPGLTIPIGGEEEAPSMVEPDVLTPRRGRGY